jgi:DNA-binding response OmpR family regulator
MRLSAVVVSASAYTAGQRRQALEEAGFTVFTAASFKEGCELLRRIRPDLLVTDVRLVDYNGLHLANRARNELPDLQTLIIGYSDVVLEEEARAVGASYLTSPDLKALTEAARQLTKGLVWEGRCSRVPP